MTHALLHSVIKDVPLWLDEGLAEFMGAVEIDEQNGHFSPLPPVEEKEYAPQ